MDILKLTYLVLQAILAIFELISHLFDDWPRPPTLR